jgi:hypothetical protein
MSAFWDNANLRFCAALPVFGPWRIRAGATPDICRSSKTNSSATTDEIILAYRSTFLIHCLTQHAKDAYVLHKSASGAVGQITAP